MCYLFGNNNNWSNKINAFHPWLFTFTVLDIKLDALVTVLNIESILIQRGSHRVPGCVQFLYLLLSVCADLFTMANRVFIQISVACGRVVMVLTQLTLLWSHIANHNHIASALARPGHPGTQHHSCYHQPWPPPASTTFICNIHNLGGKLPAPFSKDT